MKKLTIIFLTIIICQGAFAQYNKRLRELGDKAFSNKNYIQAADDYKKAMGDAAPHIAIPFSPRLKRSNGKQSADLNYLYYQLGESYRLYQNYINAEDWYYKLIDENNTVNYPLSRLWYGVCLHANGYFNEAIKQLQQFITDYKGDNKYIDIANKQLVDCLFAKEQYQHPAFIAINRMNKSWNSNGGNYALVKKGDRYYFTSSSLGINAEKNLNQIYSVPAQGSAAPAVIPFNDGKNEVEYCTPSIDSTGKRMYLTRWDKEGGKTILAICLSVLNNNKWATPVKLNANVNADGFNAIQPFVTPNGKRLFYSSNKPGGQGGYDIWVSDLDADGNPTNSTNLGPVINTPVDDEAPYYDDTNNKLIYSSKGFVGLGGFDFFESFYNDGKWAVPQNMGYPVNSAKDDLYYSPDDSVPGKFYISSDRESDCCLNVFEGFIEEINIKGKVIDCYTQNPLIGGKVSLVDSASNQVIKEVEPDENGIYTFKTTSKGPYKIILSKEGYFTKVDLVAGYDQLNNDTLFNNTICLQHFELNKAIVIKNILYDYNMATLRPEAKLVLDGIVKIMNDNPKIKIELSSHTDSIGSDAYNLNLSQARAQSCVDYIVANGIDKSRITARGYGKTKPVAPNSLPNGQDNPDGRQLNRRTEFTVVGTE